APQRRGQLQFATTLGTGRDNVSRRRGRRRTGGRRRAAGRRRGNGQGLRGRGRRTPSELRDGRRRRRGRRLHAALGGAVEIARECLGEFRHAGVAFLRLLGDRLQADF